MKFIVVFSGELAQSAFHFALNIVLIRHLSAFDYGLYAMVFATAAVMTAFARSLLAVPATLHLTRPSRGRSRAAYEVTFGSAALVFSIATGSLVGTALVFILGHSAALAGAFVASWCLRSYLRTILLALRRSRIALLSDVTFAFSGSVFVIAVIWGEGSVGLGPVFGVLGAANAIGIGFALAAIREPIVVSVRRSMRARLFALWPSLAWSLAGVSSTTLQAQGLLLLLALAIGPASFAPVAAAFALLSPLRILTSALISLTLPRLAERVANGRASESRALVFRLLTLIGACSLVYGFALLALMPFLQAHVFANRYPNAPLLMIGFGVFMAVTTSLLYAIPRAWQEANGRFRHITVEACASSALGGLVVASAVYFSSIPWAVSGLFVSEALTLVFALRGFKGHLPVQCRVPSPSPS